jgi:hypothetical protein
VTAQTKAWLLRRPLAGIVGSNPARECMSLVSVVCCQTEVSATGRALVQRIPTVSVYVYVSLSSIRCNNNSLHVQ